MYTLHKKEVKKVNEIRKYYAPMAQEIAISCEDVLNDSNEGGWAPVNDDEEE